MGGFLSLCIHYSKKLWKKSYQNRTNIKTVYSPTQAIQDELKDAFNAINSGNAIPSKKLGEVLNILGQRYDEEKVEELTKTFDPESTGEITWDQFFKEVVKMMDMGDATKLRDAIATFDEERGGYINVEQFADMLTRYGNLLDDEEAAELIREAKLNGNVDDELLHCDGFVETLTTKYL